MKDGNHTVNNLKILEKDNSFLSPDKYSGSIDIDDDTKTEFIEQKFREIMEVLGLDLRDDSLKDTPRRVANMYVKEIFSGLNSSNKPAVTLFRNKYDYNQMLIEKDITLYSTCEHHFVPIIGLAHIAYYSTGYVIGLSKLNRIVQYFSKRPQQQERLTMQIGREIMKILNTEDAAVLIEADHLCVKSRGVNDVNSKTITSFYNGKFLQTDIRNEFLTLVGK